MDNIDNVDLKVGNEQSAMKKKQNQIQRQAILKSEERQQNHGNTGIGSEVNKKKVSSLSMLKKARYKPGTQMQAGVNGNTLGGVGGGVPQL